MTIRSAILLITIFMHWPQASYAAGVGPASSVSMLAPQEKVIDGPGESTRSEKDFDLDEADFSRDREDPRFRKKVELWLGIAFLVLVVLIWFWRRGRNRV